MRKGWSVIGKKRIQGRGWAACGGYVVTKRRLKCSGDNAGPGSAGGTRLGPEGEVKVVEYFSDLQSHFIECVS